MGDLSMRFPRFCTGSAAFAGVTPLDEVRALDAHPAVHVVHDLYEVNTEADQALYRLLRVWPGAALPRWGFFGFRP